jgi:hypothetical protein
VIVREAMRPCTGWRLAHTVRCPSDGPCFTEASAVWQLPDGPFRYATLRLADLVINPE